MQPDPAIAATNQGFRDRIPWTVWSDYAAYVEYHFYGVDALRHVRVDDPALVARYVADKRRGTWGDRENNRRRRQDGRPTYPPRNWVAITTEDITAMIRQVSFEARKHPDAAAARDRFHEATRSAAFSIQLGIREIRLLGEQPWDGVQWLQAAEVTAMQKLIDKGLLVHIQGENPRLSEAGELLRQLLILSRHIVEPDDPTI